MATKKKKTGKSSSGFFLGAALGAVAGGIAGMLTAPKSGKETRADIARGTKKVGKKVQTEGKKVVTKVEKEFKKATGGKGSAKKTTKARK